jgi:hypothetical protein
MFKRVLFLLVFGLLLSKHIVAQPQFCGIYGNQCKDTISPIYVAPFLPANFDPVCGCDGKTYKNINYMWAQNVCRVQFSGPCEEVAMDMYPNPISNYLPLSYPIAHFKFITRTDNNIYFQISDLWGKLFFRQNIPIQPGNILSSDLDLGGLPTGIYMANAIANGQRAYFKIAVVN